MQKTMFALLIAAMPFSAIAQTTNPDSQDRDSVTPTTPNSGAGVPGHPGNKSGPAIKRSGTTGSDMNSGTSLKTPPKFLASRVVRVGRPPDRQALSRYQKSGLP
jgi:hypothetical protein